MARLYVSMGSFSKLVTLRVFLATRYTTVVVITYYTCEKLKAAFYWEMQHSALRKRKTNFNRAPRCLFHFSQGSRRFCGRPCASACLQVRCGLRPQHLLRRGLRPHGRHRRLRRRSARPSDALRCCRIQLHWPATTPWPRGIPPNGRELRNGPLK